MNTLDDYPTTSDDHADEDDDCDCDNLPDPVPCWPCYLNCEADFRGGDE